MVCHSSALLKMCNIIIFAIGAIHLCVRQTFVVQLSNYIVEYKKDLFVQLSNYTLVCKEDAFVV